MFKFFHDAPYAVCVELKNFYLFVFCFGGLLFVACVGVRGCGDVRGWRGCCRGGDVWKFVRWGYVGRVGTCRLYSV